MTTVEIVDRSSMISQLKDMLEVNPRSTAIVTIDMHRGHLDPEVATMPCAPEDCQRVIRYTQMLLEFAREQGIPVIHVITVYRRIPGLGSEAKAMRHKLAQYIARIRDETNRHTPGRRCASIDEHNIEGSVQTQIIPQLFRQGDYVINNKKRNDCFIGTDLETLLQALQVDTTVLVGINTATCVLNTAFTASNKGFKLIVISDCVASMSGQDLHIFGLQNISRGIGFVLTAEEFQRKVLAAKTGQ